MAIIRPPMSWDGITPVPNRWMRDPRASLKEKGLLAYIIGHAAGYELTVEQIVEESTDGKDAVLSGLRKLEQLGYLRRTRLRNEDGTWGSYDYEIVEHQGGSDQGGKTRTGSDQPKDDVSAAQDQRGLSGAENPPTKKTTSKKTREKTTSETSSPRGTRLPADFAVTEEMRTWFMTQRFGGTSDFWRGQHEQFIDYWAGRPGQAGVKLDWPATWRNWMRKAAERIAPAGAPRPPYRSTEEKRDEARKREAAIAAIADQLAAARGASGRDPVENQRIGEEARRIYEAQVRAGNDSGYTVASDNPGTVDGEWTEQTRKEVTAGEPQRNHEHVDLHRAA